MKCEIFLPMRGTKFEVAGIFSAMSNMKTEKARRTVSPNETFSPESADIQNTSSVSEESITQGMITL